MAGSVPFKIPHVSTTLASVSPWLLAFAKEEQHFIGSNKACRRMGYQKQGVPSPWLRQCHFLDFRAITTQLHPLYLQTQNSMPMGLCPCWLPSCPMSQTLRLAASLWSWETTSLPWRHRGWCHLGLRCLHPSVMTWPLHPPSSLYWMMMVCILDL